MTYWPLAGLAIVVIGFALRFNPLWVCNVVIIYAGAFLLWN